MRGSAAPVLTLSGFVTMSNTFHITSSNIIHCQYKNTDEGSFNILQRQPTVKSQITGALTQEKQDTLDEKINHS